MTLKVTLDTKDFQRGLKRLKSTLPRELANALNRVAGAARTEFNAAARQEIGFRSPRGIVAPRTVELPNARTDSLKSEFSPSRVTKNMAVLGKYKPSAGKRARQAITVPTHGGKTFAKGFAIKSKYSGGVVLFDNSPGKLGKTPHALKTTSFARLMEQDGSEPRRKWQKVAETNLTFELPDAVEKAFEKAGLK